MRLAHETARERRGRRSCESPTTARRGCAAASRSTTPIPTQRAHPRRGNLGRRRLAAVGRSESAPRLGRWPPTWAPCSTPRCPWEATMSSSPATAVWRATGTKTGVWRMGDGFFTDLNFDGRLPLPAQPRSARALRAEHRAGHGRLRSRLSKGRGRPGPAAHQAGLPQQLPPRHPPRPTDRRRDRAGSDDMATRLRHPCATTSREAPEAAAFYRAHPRPRPRSPASTRDSEESHSHQRRRLARADPTHHHRVASHS